MDQQLPAAWPIGGEMAERIRAHRWADTPLGPIAGWPQSLRTAVDLLLAMPGPATLLIGPTAVQLYNDAYRAIARDRHPALLGRPVAEGWPDAMEVVAPLLDAVRAGRATRLSRVSVRLSGADGCWEDRLFDTDWSPVRDEHGAVAGALQTLVEVTAASRAEAALRNSEERFRTLAEAIADVFYITDVDHGALAYLSPAYERIWGRPAAELQADLSAFERTIHPDDLPVFETGKATQARGERVEAEYRIVRPDGEIRWIRDRSFPVDDGGTRRAAGVASDVTDRKLAESALAESEGRLRTLIEGIPQLVWRGDAEGRWTWASPQWARFTGQSAQESLGKGWLQAIHPSDRALAESAWDLAAANGRIDLEFRVHRAADGAWIWHHTRSLPVRDEAGTITEWLGTTTDVQQLKELQHRQGVLVAELQHRVRNILAVIRSVFGRTAEAGHELEAMADHFRGRLDALARTQVIVTGSASGQVDLEGLIRDELLSVGVGDGPNIQIDGPEVKLAPKTAESLGLAVHELTTNAVKYGALKVKTGSLYIYWTINPGYGDAQLLDFTWREQGVPIVPLRPARQGFGRELIEEALPYRLQAETELEFGPGGVRCRIQLPLSGGETAMRRSGVT